MGRRGLTGIKEFIMGSVPHKVLRSVKDVSIVIVSGRVGFGVLCVFEEIF
jgi:nucleotide-binding universal stress UspA family protein